MRIASCLLALLLCVMIFPAAAFADEPEASEAVETVEAAELEPQTPEEQPQPEPEASAVEPVQQTEVIPETTPEPSPEPDSPSRGSDYDTYDYPESPDITITTPMTVRVLSLDEPEPLEAESTMLAAIDGILGPYTPRTQTVTEYLPDGSSVEYQEYVPGLAGLDWNWIAGAVIFTVAFWSLFVLIGVVMKRV